MSRKTKSVFDRALGPKRRKKRRERFGGMANMLEPKRGRKKHLALANATDMLIPTGGRKHKNRGMAQAVIASLRERISPTERAQVKHEVDEAIEQDPRLRAQAASSQAMPYPQETFIQRVIRIAKERLARP